MIKINIKDNNNNNNIFISDHIGLDPHVCRKEKGNRK